MLEVSEGIDLQLLVLSQQLSFPEELSLVNCSSLHIPICNIYPEHAKITLP